MAYFASYECAVLNVALFGELSAGSLFYLIDFVLARTISFLLVI